MLLYLIKMYELLLNLLPFFVSGFAAVICAELPENNREKNPDFFCSGAAALAAGLGVSWEGRDLSLEGRVWIWGAMLFTADLG